MQLSWEEDLSPAQEASAAPLKTPTSSVACTRLAPRASWMRFPCIPMAETRAGARPEHLHHLLRRVELSRKLMVELGDARTPMWATEYGWLTDSGTYLGQYDWMKVSESDQAAYVLRSFQYAQKNWPWMQGMLLSNLDASTTPYHQGAEDGMPWFAILNGDYSPREAYTVFKDMRADQIAVIEARKKSEREAQANARAQTAQQEAAASQGDSNEVPADDQPPADANAASPTQLRVSGTGGEGLSLRMNPSSTAPRIKTLTEGANVQATGAEQSADGRVWKQVKDSSGATGWAAAQYLK